RNIGQRALQRVLSEHTYAHRALEVERALGARSGSDQVQLRPTRTESRQPPATLASGVSLGTEATRLNIVMLGLSITSSWGNGHATTYRALVRELSRLGHRV